MALWPFPRPPCLSPSPHAMCDTVTLSSPPSPTANQQSPSPYLHRYRINAEGKKPTRGRRRALRSKGGLSLLSFFPPPFHLLECIELSRKGALYWAKQGVGKEGGGTEGGRKDGYPEGEMKKKHNSIPQKRPLQIMELKNRLHFFDSIPTTQPQPRHIIAGFLCFLKSIAFRCSLQHFQKKTDTSS